MITVNKPVLQEEDWGELSEYSSGGLQQQWDKEDEELMSLYDTDENPGVRLSRLQGKLKYWALRKTMAKTVPERAACDAMIDMIREAMDES